MVIIYFFTVVWLVQTFSVCPSVLRSFLNTLLWSDGCTLAGPYWLGMFNIKSLSRLNSVSCIGFVKKSAIIPPVGQ